jgi:hypothetical protein
MSMHLTHDDAPGHVADATEHGWQCTCGAGNTWEDSRPRSRGVGGARRHLTAAARSRPENTPREDVTPREDDAAAIRQAAANGPAETPHAEMSQAEKVQAARDAAAATRQTVAEFRSPPSNVD